LDEVFIFTMQRRWYHRRFLIPNDLVSRWHKQTRTEYSDLSENEKESDREQARKIIKILKQ